MEPLLDRTAHGLIRKPLEIHSASPIHLQLSTALNQRRHKDGLPSVVLATTHWTNVSPADGIMRETELKENPNMWKRMIEWGSQVWRQDGDYKSTSEIIQYLISLKRPKDLERREELDRLKAEIEYKQDQIRESERKLQADREQLRHHKEEEARREVENIYKQLVEKEKLIAEQERLQFKADSEQANEQLKHWKAEAARLQEELDNHNGGRSTCVIL
ncbi:hypothetical protein V8E54_009519 [Elaphomyces granulatus]